MTSGVSQGQQLNVAHEATGRCPPVCREHGSGWVGTSPMAMRR